MGLRINTNPAALTALRTLKVNDRNQLRSLERLSTGLRINRGADDPSGLVISETLRSQVGALKQAVENTQNDLNMIAVADAGLAQINELLVKLRDSTVFAMNTGAATPEQIASEQKVVDQIIDAIDRLAATTRFGDRELLNGTAGFQTVSSVPGAIDDLRLRKMVFANGSFTRTVTIEMPTFASNPERAKILITDASAPAGAALRITGVRGTADVVIASGAVASSIARAINQVGGLTGVFASGGTGPAADVALFSEEFGSDQFIRLEVTAGSISSATATFTDFTPTVIPGPVTAGMVRFDRGDDGVIEFEGQRFRGVGRHFRILTNTADFEFNLDPALLPLASGATFSFVVGNTGLRFQINELNQPTDFINIGIETVNSSTLGAQPHADLIEMAAVGGIAPSATPVLKKGFLSTLKTGGANSLTNNPGNAGNVVDAALEQLNSLRGFLGSIAGFILEPNEDFLNVHIDKLTESISTIRDLDFAEESSNFVRTQIIFQSNVAVLAASNALPQSVLTLLGV